MLYTFLAERVGGPDAFIKFSNPIGVYSAINNVELVKAVPCCTSTRSINSSHCLFPSPNSI